MMPRGRPKKIRTEMKLVKVVRGAPPCPDDLSDLAKKKWKELVGALKSANILSSADSDTMARYCEEAATWTRANKKIDEDGEVLVGPNGGDIQNPYLSIRNKAAITLGKMSEQLGLDPLSRQRLHVSVDSPDARADKFFKNREK